MDPEEASVMHSSSSSAHHFASPRAQGCTGLGRAFRIAYHHKRRPRACILSGVRSNRRRGNALTARVRQDHRLVAGSAGGHEAPGTHCGPWGPAP